MKSYKLKVNESQFEVVIKEVNPAHVIAMVNGVEQKILIEEIKNLKAPASVVREQARPAASSAPMSAPVSAPRPTQAARPSAASGEGVTAPIPGQVKVISVKVGDAVKAGQKVLIIEAMKLENEINAPKAGTVKSILVNVGDSVNQDQLMVEIA